MKKKLYCIICLCSLISIMLCACGKDVDINVTDISDGLESEYQLSDEKQDMIPMVMVNDVIYLYTGHNREVEERRDTFDGEITSEVDGSKKPTVNDQSNFGTGYGYQYGPIEGMIDIYMNDQWQVFATEKIIASDTLILE